MDELISKLQEKAGLTADQAKQAINTMVDYVKGKIPASLHGNIDALFSSAKDKAGVYAEQAREKLEDLSGKAEDLATEARGKAEEIAKELGDKLSGFLGNKKS